MRTRQNYIRWLLPQFTRDPAWLDYVNAVSDELVSLSSSMMGTFDSNGNTGGDVINNGNFVNREGWQVFDSTFNPQRPSSQGGDFTRDSTIQLYPGSEGIFSFAVRWLPNITPNQQFKVRFRYIVYGSDPECSLFLGQSNGVGVEVPINTSTTEEQEVEIDLTLDDYFLYFLLFYNNTTGFVISNVEIISPVGEDENRKHNVIQAYDFDETASYILDKMYRSFDLPIVSGMPDELVRRFIRENVQFQQLAGTSLGSLMLFYFLGYGVRFKNLYARIGDYEGTTYPWTSQLDLVKYESVGAEVFAEVDEDATLSYTLKLKDGHVVLTGDMLNNESNPFVNTWRHVVKVEGNTITLDRETTAYEFDKLTISRQPDYPINPDPDFYFKIPWVDVFIKNQFIKDVTISFEDLRAFLYTRLPANVCIRNISFDQSQELHLFWFDQTSFKIDRGFIFELTFAHDPVLASGDRSDVLVVESPGTDPLVVDIFGTPVDDSSFVLEEPDGDYVVIDYYIPEAAGPSEE